MIVSLPIDTLKPGYSFSNGQEDLCRRVTLTGDLVPGPNTTLRLHTTQPIKLTTLIQKGKVLDFIPIQQGGYQITLPEGRFEHQIGQLLIRYGNFAGQTYEVPLIFDTSNGLKEKEALVGAGDDHSMTSHLFSNLELGIETNPETYHANGALDRDQGELLEYGNTIPLSGNIKSQIAKTPQLLEKIELEASLAIGIVQTRLAKQRTGICTSASNPCAVA